ncbi:hypothetical protein FHX44_116341 [Pseudonocardia hierapolitana]|uniref:Uncharacterized protein n=1 Tax=Pseudonocardia hierapolitana TaxID=1128676 RepID=A0A561SZV4_9PSEU|nr:hypothetical protein [Pseudonocardia hierapolitana]TWF80398.1 hypothetical protein FHX44_116341 [Pseudonocardia hierapolitana]
MREILPGALVVALTSIMIFGAAGPSAYAEEGGRKAIESSAMQVVSASSEGPDLKRGQPMGGRLALLPTAVRECGIITCSVYYSKQETVAMQKKVSGLSGSPALNFCKLLSETPVGPYCADVNSFSQMKGNLDAAVKRKGCIVARYRPLPPNIVTGNPISFGNVAGNHKNCK